MVLDVYVQGLEECMECQYSGFSKFRCEILRGWNEDLGKSYEKRYGFQWEKRDEFNVSKFTELLLTRKEEEIKIIDGEMKKILDEFDKPYNEGMKLFFYHSDCDGVFSPEECVLVLQSFGCVNIETFDNSDEKMNHWYKENYNIWIKMLNYAFEHNKPIIFG